MADNIFTKLFNRKEQAQPVQEQQEERSIFGGLGLAYGSSSTYSNSMAMKLATAFACTNILSNAVAMMPIKVMTNKNGKKEEVVHSLTQILNLRPNVLFNHYNFFKNIIESVILEGNGYAFIERDERLNVKQLRLLNPAFVQPMLQGDGTVKYIVAGVGEAIDSANMIHLFQHCDEMYNGISVIKYGDMTLRSAFDTEKQASLFYQRGAGLLGVLKAASPLNDAQKAQIAQSWEKSISRTQGGGIAILPQGLDFQPISISPEDAQLLESRQYDTISICKFFGVSPFKVFDYSHMSYSSLEQVSLSFLQDSVLPYAQMIIDEFNRKLFKPSEVGKYEIGFDFSALLKTDKKSESEYYRTLVTTGLATINEVREKLGFSPLEGDEYNQAYMQLSYASVKNIAEGAYVKQTPQDQSSSTKNDNKVINKE